MKRIAFVFFAGAAFVLLTVSFSCSKDSSDGNNSGNGGNDSVLVNLSNNIILPYYQSFSTAASALDAAVIAFNAAPGTTTLSAVQGAFKTAYKAWEPCSELEFGPAADQSLTTTTINVFPTDTTVIKSNISSGVYTIDAISNFKAQGFPALDYLLFSKDNASVLARFTTDSKAATAKQYMAAVSGSIKTKAAAVLNAWSSSGGNYAGKFIAATGVNAGSSLSILTNSYVYGYDVIFKNYKLGIPIGFYGPTTLPQSPDKVEGFYSGISLQLMLAQVQAMQNIYLGGAGGGLDDKVAATPAQKSGSPLNTVIKNELGTVITKIQGINDPLSGAIATNYGAVNDLYTEVQKLVVLVKVDMSSALAIKISFQDDDGD